MNATKQENFKETLGNDLAISEAIAPFEPNKLRANQYAIGETSVATGFNSLSLIVK